MKVVLLNGGYANRMRSVTNNGEIPKSLLPINVDGEIKPILYHILDNVERVPVVDEIMVVVNDKYKEQFKEALSFYNSKKPITMYSDGSTCPENARGANVAIQIANQNIPQSYHGDVVVMASDNYFEFELTDLVYHFEGLKAEWGDDVNLIVSKRYPDKDREYIAKNFGILDIDEDNRILGLDEKPGIENLKSNNVSLALYIFNRPDLNMIEDYMAGAEGKARDSMGYFANYIIQNTTTFTYPLGEDEVFADIGTPEEYYAFANGETRKA